MVIWSLPARNDLKEIHGYIAKDSRHYAEKTIEDIVSKSENLSHFPQIGRVVPEINNSYIREIQTNSFRLIYQLVQKDVIVLAVIHSRRDLTALNALF